MNKLCFTFLTLALGAPALAHANDQAATDSATAKTAVSGSATVSAKVTVSDQDALGDDILAVINLPIAAADAREAGVDEVELKEALDVTRETGLSAGDASEVVAEEAEQSRARGVKKGFGHWVKMQVAAGLRGKALAAKIKARKTDTQPLDEKKSTELREKLEKQRELNKAWRAKATEKRTELIAKGKKKVVLHEDRNEKLKAKIQAAQGRNEERGDAVDGRLKDIDARIKAATGDDKKALEAEKKRLEGAAKINEKVEDRLEKAEDKAEKKDDKLDKAGNKLDKAGDKLKDKTEDRAEKREAKADAKGDAKGGNKGARTPGPAAPTPAQ